MISCETSPQEVKEIEYISVPTYPELMEISDYSPEEKTELLAYMTNLYSSHLELLLACRSTGLFVNEQIEEEIDYCQRVLDWIESVVSPNTL